MQIETQYGKCTYNPALRSRPDISLLQLLITAVDHPPLKKSATACQPRAHYRRKTRHTESRSGGTLKDADVILVLYRARVYKDDVPADEEKIAEVIIGKQRNGPIGTVKLVFLPEYARFENIADSHRTTPQPF